MVLARPLACLALVAALAAPVAAQPTGGSPPADAKTLAKGIAEEAGQKYNLGQFQEALELYTRSYDTFPAPGLLFNLGQCHRALGNHERAVFFFEGYLREKPNAPNRDVVDELLTEERAALARQRTEEAARAEADRKAKEEADRQRAEEARRARAAEAERRAREDEDRRRAAMLTGGAGATGGEGTSIVKTWWFWTAVGGAVALAAGTAYFATRDRTELAEGSLGRVDGRM